MAEFGTSPTLRSYLVVVQRRKWWVIGLALVGLAGSLALSLTQAKQYSATAQLLVQSSGQGVNLGGAQQSVTTTDVQTDLQLATSAPVVRARAEETGQRPGHLDGRIAQTNVIALTAISSSPARAALIANAYANAYVTQTRQVAISNLTAAQAQLQSQITRAHPADQVAAGTAQPGRAGKRAGQPGSRAQGGGGPASGQRGRGDQRRRTRHPGPGSVLAEFPQAGPRMPCSAWRPA